jgi:hypothetical protein
MYNPEMNEQDVKMITDALTEISNIKKIENLSAQYVILQERLNHYKYLHNLHTEAMRQTINRMEANGISVVSDDK